MAARLTTGSSCVKHVRARLPVVSLAARMCTLQERNLASSLESLCGTGAMLTHGNSVTSLYRQDAEGAHREDHGTEPLSVYLTVKETDKSAFRRRRTEKRKPVA